MTKSRGVRIPNPVNLNKKVPELPRGSAFDPITRAEQALEKLSYTFGQWMDSEIARLTKAWANASEEMNIETLIDLYAIGHDLKGEAETFGFPLAGFIADSMCRMLDAFEPMPHEAPMALIEQHVQAIKAIVSEKAQNSADPVGRQLVDELADQADKAIAAVEKS